MTKPLIDNDTFNKFKVANDEAKDRFMKEIFDIRESVKVRNNNWVLYEYNYCLEQKWFLHNEGKRRMALIKILKINFCEDFLIEQVSYQLELFDDIKYYTKKIKYCNAILQSNLISDEAKDVITKLIPLLHEVKIKSLKLCRQIIRNIGEPEKMREISKKIQAGEIKPRNSFNCISILSKAKQLMELEFKNYELGELNQITSYLGILLDRLNDELKMINNPLDDNSKEDLRKSMALCNDAISAVKGVIKKIEDEIQSRPKSAVKH